MAYQNVDDNSLIKNSEEKDETSRSYSLKRIVLVLVFVLGVLVGGVATTSRSSFSSQLRQTGTPLLQLESTDVKTSDATTTYMVEVTTSTGGYVKFEELTDSVCTASACASYLSTGGAYVKYDSSLQVLNVYSDSTCSSLLATINA